MKRFALILGCLLSLPAFAVNVRFALTVNYDASYSTAYPAGDKPDAGNVAPVWNATPSPNFVIGSATSINLNPAYVSDGNGDTLGIDNETGCTLPTGVSIDDPNDQIDYSGGGSAGTTTGCIFSAEDGTAAEVNSAAFSIIIANSDSEAADRTVCASGCTHTSFDAAMDAAADGEIIEGRAATPGGTFTDNTAINTANSGASGFPIVTRCRTGDTCVITGSAGSGSDRYAVRITGAWHDFGGVTIQGSASPGGGCPTCGEVTSDVDRSIFIEGAGASNNIIRNVIATNTNLHGFRITAGANNTLINVSCYLCGGLDNGIGNDFGDVLEFETAATPGLIYGAKVAAIGHAAIQHSENLFMVKYRGENLWDQEFDNNHPGVTTDGNRVLSMDQQVKDTVLQGFLFGPTGQPYETTGTQVLRAAYEHGRIQRGMVIGQRDGTGGGINSNRPSGDYGARVHFIYLTVTDHNGPCVSVVGPALGNGNWTESRVNFYHSLFYNCNVNPGGGASNSKTFSIEYDGNSQDKCDPVGAFGNAFETGSTFYFKNRRPGGSNATYTLTQMQTDCPNDWVGNIEIGDPQFVDDAMPRVARPITVYTDTDITNDYADFAPQASSLLNVSGLPGVTQLSGAASGVSTFDVDATDPFHEGTTQGGITIPGNEICIEGHGAATITNIVDSNTLTVGENVTASDNARVYLGDDCTPNIGWYQGVGNAFGNL